MASSTWMEVKLCWRLRLQGPPPLTVSAWGGATSFSSPFHFSFLLLYKESASNTHGQCKKRASPSSQGKFLSDKLITGQSPVPNAPYLSFHLFNKSTRHSQPTRELGNQWITSFSWQIRKELLQAESCQVFFYIDLLGHFRQQHPCR